MRSVGYVHGSRVRCHPPLTDSTAPSTSSTFNIDCSRLRRVFTSTSMRATDTGASLAASNPTISSACCLGGNAVWMK